MKAKKSYDKAKEKEYPLIEHIDQYLLPLLEKIKVELNAKARQSVCEGLLHDFIRGYISYYTPNAKRTVFPFDVDVRNSVKKMFSSFSFSKNSSKPQAINLVVEENFVTDIKNCLQKDVTAGEYLSSIEVQELKECGIDISRLNPGVSGLWHKTSRDKLPDILSVDKKLFPSEEDKITYKKIIYRGQGSLSSGLLTTMGEKKKIKLKFGEEIHTDLFVSAIFKLCVQSRYYVV